MELFLHLIVELVDSLDALLEGDLALQLIVFDLGHFLLHLQVVFLVLRIGELGPLFVVEQPRLDILVLLLSLQRTLALSEWNLCGNHLTLALQQVGILLFGLQLGKGLYFQIRNVLLEVLVASLLAICERALLSDVEIVLRVLLGLEIGCKKLPIISRSLRTLLMDICYLRRI